MSLSPKEPSGPRPRLTLWDTTSLIVGIIVGVGIFFTPQSIFRNSPNAWVALGLWLAAGVMCIIGAFCFAELGSTYPRSGGEYVYLSRAFGPWAGFLFGWGQLTVNRAGASVGVIAYAFGSFFASFVGIARQNTIFPCIVGALAIVVLTVVNMLGVRTGKNTQNALTVLKVAGLGVLLVAGFFFGQGWAGLNAPPADAPGPALASMVGLAGSAAGQGPLLVASALTPEQAPTFLGKDFWMILSGLTMAMIAILWTYSGWHEAAYVISEVQDQRRTIPRALLLGVVCVILLYLAVNLACLLGVGFGTAQTSPAIAAVVLSGAFGDWAGQVMTLLIMLSALGALNGTIITSSRIYAAIGADHPLFAPLGQWHPRWGTPLVALAVQGVLSVLFVLAVGFLFEGRDSFDVLLACTAAVFWIIFLMTGVSFFVLRVKDRHLDRTFRVPFYPFTPILFCLCCVGMTIASLIADFKKSLIGLGLLVAGVPFFLLSQWLKKKGWQWQGVLPAATITEEPLNAPETHIREGLTDPRDADRGL